MVTALPLCGWDSELFTSWRFGGTCLIVASRQEWQVVGEAAPGPYQHQWALAPGLGSLGRKKQRMLGRTQQLCHVGVCGSLHLHFFVCELRKSIYITELLKSSKGRQGSGAGLV